MKITKGINEKEKCQETLQDTNNVNGNVHQNQRKGERDVWLLGASNSKFQIQTTNIFRSLSCSFVSSYFPFHSWSPMLTCSNPCACHMAFSVTSTVFSLRFEFLQLQHRKNKKKNSTTPRRRTTHLVTAQLPNSFSLNFALNSQVIFSFHSSTTLTILFQ